MEGLEVVTMNQGVHGSSLFPISNDKDVCVGGVNHNG